MWSTCLRTTRGWCKGRRSWRGGDGILIRASGLVGRIFRLESGSESAFSPVLVGAGRTGGLTGTTTMSSTTTSGTIRVAEPFTTAMSITAAAMADRKRSAVAWTGRPPPAGMFTTALALRRDHSKETIAQHAGTPHPAVRAIRVPARSAITITAESHGAIRREAARVLAVEALMAAEHRTEVVARITSLRRGLLAGRAGVCKGGV